MKLNVETKVIHEVNGVDVTLTIEQAIALAFITGDMTGDPNNVLMKGAAQIHTKLYNLGIDTDKHSHLFSNYHRKFCQCFPEDIVSIKEDMVAAYNITPDTVDSPSMQACLREGNKIGWIKEYRERMANAGQPQGLKESKDVADRRFQEYRNRRGW